MDFWGWGSSIERAWSIAADGPAVYGGTVAILALGERCIIRESPKAVARPRAISVRAQRAYKK